MTQILDALPTQYANKILCYYHNPAPDLQIVRIANVPHWYFERVVFPGDVLLFETVATAVLEVYCNDGIATLLAARFLCDRLQIATPVMSAISRTTK